MKEKETILSFSKMWKILVPIASIATALYFDFVSIGYKWEGDSKYLNFNVKINIERLENIGKALKRKIEELEER